MSGAISFGRMMSAVTVLDPTHAQTARMNGHAHPYVAYVFDRLDVL
jgi:hypothetical protein